MQHPPNNNNPSANAGFGQPQQFSPYPGQYPQRNKVNPARLLLALVFLGGSIFFIHALYASLFPAVVPQSLTATDTLDSFCSSLKSHDYQTAYSNFSNTNGQFKNEAEFASFFTNFDTTLGGITDCSILNVNENDSSGIANGSVWLNYADGTTITANAKLVHESSNWKISSLNFN